MFAEPIRACERTRSPAICSGDAPMTGAPASHLETRADEAGEAMEQGRIWAEAAVKLGQLRAEPGTGS